MTVHFNTTGLQPNDAPLQTQVELIWLEGRAERWIRFGRSTGETIIDRRQRILAFAPGSVFAFVRWASNDFGTILSRIIATSVAALGVTASSFFHPSPRLIWNVSPSVPIGLYTVHPTGKLEVGELVVLRPPVALADFLARRNYLSNSRVMLLPALSLSNVISGERFVMVGY